MRPASKFEIELHVPYVGHYLGEQNVEWIPVIIHGPVRDVVHSWPPEVKKELGGGTR